MNSKADQGDRRSDIHFILSNADRRKIIEELQTQSLKLNEVAKKLDITATEAFRQLQRLTDAGLLEKNSDGKYLATVYSKLILESSSAMTFLSAHREYFLDHDTSLIPPQLRARFGELSKAVLLANPVDNLNATNEILRKAEWIELMAEQRLENHGQLIRERIMKDEIKVRTVMKASLADKIKGELIVSSSSETRTLPKIVATIIRTDKSSGFALPRLDGKMDYQVFACIDPDSWKWVGDLFEDQWNKARPWHP